MPSRPLVWLAVVALLAGCSSHPAEEPVSQPVRESHSPDKVQNHLTGSVVGVPAGAEVELALLILDRRGQPERLISNLKLSGRGSELPFSLQFNPEAFPQDRRVELRGRVTQSGRLIMRLAPRPILRATDQLIGPLHLEPAP